jgi:hypothetical protein
MDSPPSGPCLPDSPDSARNPYVLGIHVRSVWIPVSNGQNVRWRVLHLLRGFPRCPDSRQPVLEGFRAVPPVTGSLLRGSGYNSIADLSHLAEAMLRGGLGENDIRAYFAGNLMRVLSQAIG